VPFLRATKGPVGDGLAAYRWMVRDDKVAHRDLVFNPPEWGLEPPLTCPLLHTPKNFGGYVGVASLIIKTSPYTPMTYFAT